MASGIPHYPELIDGFEKDHRVLLHSYGRLVQLAKPQTFSTFQKELAEFKSTLVSHLLKEAVKLYIYLRQQLKHEPASYGLVTRYKTEMDGIGKVAMDFIDRYSALNAGQVDFEILDDELNGIGKVLGDRIRREEAELYPLYHASY